jgi:hypothetical protein
MTHGRSPSRPGSPVGGGQAGPVPGCRSLTGAGARGRGRGGQPGPCAIEPGGRGYRRPDQGPCNCIFLNR